MFWKSFTVSMFVVIRHVYHMSSATVNCLGRGESFLGILGDVIHRCDCRVFKRTCWSADEIHVRR